MIYKFEEYVEAFPKKNVSTLKKFVGEAKNLHEMSTEEINAIIATWGAATSGTAANQKSIISLYFDWLTENGVTVAANIDSIVIPIKSAEFLIYSSENLHEYWEKFFTSCERQSAITGDFFSRDKYLTSYVASILSFYGLTSEQILALDLSDVQKDGIIGYDLPLTQTDIDVLLEYKGLNELANNKKVSGHKYIRAAGVVNEDTLYKKDYEAYRAERMEYEAKNNAEYVAKIDKAFEQLEKVAEPKPDVSGLLEALKYVDVAISEVDKIKVNLLGIKAQITKFVK